MWGTQVSYGYTERETGVRKEGASESARERERERETDRQTDRQTEVNRQRKSLWDRGREID